MIFVQDTPLVLGVELSADEDRAWRERSSKSRREMQWRAVRAADGRACNALHIYAPDGETRISACRETDGSWRWGFVIDSVMYGDGELSKRYGLPREKHDDTR